MHKTHKKLSYITGYLREFATIFTLTVFTFSLVGKIIINIDMEMHGITSIHTHDRTGLPYSTIFQLFSYSVLMAFVSRFLFCESVAEKLSLQWRSLLFLIVTLIVTAFFSVIFNWFPVNNFFAWLLFIPAFLGSYGVAMGLSYIIMKLDDKKYNKLLENFKNKHKNDMI